MSLGSYLNSKDFSRFVLRMDECVSLSIVDVQSMMYLAKYFFGGPGSNHASLSVFEKPKNATGSGDSLATVSHHVHSSMEEGKKS